MSIEAGFAVPHPPLIIPAVGRGNEREIQTTIDAYDEVARQVAALEPELVIVTSPHAPAYRDWFHVSPGAGASGDMLDFRARNTELSCTYDEEFVRLLTRRAADGNFPAGAEGRSGQKLDHATYIPLWFINKFYSGYKVVRIGLSGFGPLEHYHLGQLIAQCVEELGRKAVFVASGDLSHKLKADGPYGLAPEGPVFDAQITQAFAEGDFLQLLTFDEAFTDAAAECGLRSFQIMAGAFDGQALRSELLSYEPTTGVGYGIASFYPVGADEQRRLADQLRGAERERMAARLEREDAYIRLARRTIEAHVRGEAFARPDGLPPEMLEQKAGVFVSLHKLGRLRGCIGTTGPVTGCIADEIMRNAVSACSEDPRFDAVRPDELAELEISVDVLSPAEAISSPSELDVKRYGVIVSNGYRRGLLLPNLDGVSTVDEQISIAKQKAGIGAYEDCKLQRFEVVRHEVVE